MKILVLGSGAREHALAWRIAQSRSVQKVWVAPGNALVGLDFELVPLVITDPEAVVALARALVVDLVVVGPEAPLLAGVVDALGAAGFLAVGPTRAAAALEGSKGYAKKTMLAAGVPTPRFELFDSSLAAKEWLAEHPGRHVVKADGLMAGKGVILCESQSSAFMAVDELFALGQRAVLIEERLVGREASLIALCDGERYRLLPLARDFKRIGTGDTGKNTGGMGAYCPVHLTKEEIGRKRPSDAELAELAIAPILRQQHEQGSPFRGFLFAGLLFHQRRAQVLEYNCRLGDPETQSLLTAIDGDLVPALFGAAVGDLREAEFPSLCGAAVTVVLASAGYPDAPVLGAPIVGVGAAKRHPHVQVFGAGVTLDGGTLRVSGGRVLSVVAHGASVAEARGRAYAAADEIDFEGSQRREDIGGGW